MFIHSDMMHEYTWRRKGFAAFQSIAATAQKITEKQFWRLSDVLYQNSRDKLTNENIRSLCQYLTHEYRFQLRQHSWNF